MVPAPPTVHPGTVQYSNGHLDTERDPAEPPRVAYLIKRVHVWCDRRAMRSSLASPTAVVFTVVALLQLVGLAMQGTDWPINEEHWQKGDALWWVFNCVSVAGLIITVALAFALTRALVKRDQDLALQQHCRSIARYAIRKGNLPQDYIGVHVWILEQPRLWLLPQRVSSWFDREDLPRVLWWLAPVRVLRRRAEYIPERRLHPPLVFHERTGVAGQCIRLQREVVVDLEPFLRDATASEFYKRSYDERLGLSWRHWRNSRQFHVIWATPLFGRRAGLANIEFPGARRLVGCLTIDVQEPGHLPKVQQLIDDKDPELQSLIWDCAAVLTS